MLVEGVSPKPPETHNCVMRAADFDKSAIIFAIPLIHFQISFGMIMPENQIEVRLTVSISLRSFLALLVRQFLISRMLCDIVLL